MVEGLSRSLEGILQQVSIADAVRSFGAETVGRARVLGREATARVAQITDPLPTNAEIFRLTGNEPVVFVTGYTAPREVNLALKRFYKERGIPFYLVNTGWGHNPIENNAENVLRSIRRALDETGAEGFHLMGHSKGGKDLMKAMAVGEAIRGENLLGRLRTAMTLGTPHEGGLTAHDGVAALMLSMAGRVTERHPRFRAGQELIKGHPELVAQREGLPRLLDAAADDFRMYAITSPRDGLVPQSSSRLAIDHPKLANVTLRHGPFNHMTLHQNPQVQRHALQTYTQNSERTRAYVRARENGTLDEMLGR